MPLELNYGNIRGQEAMLKDAVRCEAFRKAIAETVTAGDVVLDIGAGTGLLSLFAAQAGARHVYAVERTEIVDLARHIIEANGFSDRITVYEEDIQNVTLPEPVDVIVSEWLGGYALDENLLPIVVQARDRWLKPGGTLIPDSVSSLIVPVHDVVHQQDLDFWNSYPYGLELGTIGTIRSCESYSSRNDIKQGRINCAPQVMWEIDVARCSEETAVGVFETQLTFTAQRDGPVNALAAWFDARLSKTVRLCNGPAEPDTHWGRSVFPIGQVVEVSKGDDVAVHFTHIPEAPGHSVADWSVAIGDGRFRSSDATILAR